jgi:hypothetical protein
VSTVIPVPDPPVVATFIAELYPVPIGGEFTVPLGIDPTAKKS